MQLPQLMEYPQSKETTEEFKGYDHNLRTMPGEWYDMKNMTCDNYPVASTRDKRSVQYVSEEEDISSPATAYRDTKLSPILASSSIAGDLLTLSQIKRWYTPSKIKYGKWLFKNGDLITYTNSVCDVVYKCNNGVFISSESKRLAAIVDLDGNFNLLIIGEGDAEKGNIYSSLEPYRIINERSYNITDISLQLPSGTLRKPLCIVSISGTYISYILDYSADIARDIDRVIIPSGYIGKQLVNTDPFAFSENVTGNEQMLRMGSYICTFPDGVVYESNNKNTDTPLFKIQKKKSLEDNLYFETVVKDSSTGRYKKFTIDNNAAEIEGNYRAVSSVSPDGKTIYTIQQYINTSASGDPSYMWVDQPTYVKIGIGQLYDNGTYPNYGYRNLESLDEFDVGDSITIKSNKKAINTTTPFSDGELFGLFNWNSKESKYSEPSCVIKDIYNEHIHNERELIVDGLLVRKTANGLLYSYYWENDGGDIERKLPDMAYVCESQNRLWGCSSDGHEIYASALGNPYNWYDYSGLSTDSYAVNVGSDGLFTGCFSYLGTPMFFKENSVHIISGSYPTNAGSIDGGSYQVTTYDNFKGCEAGSEKSFAVIDNILYYKSKAGIVAYDGATTTVISSALGKDRYKNAVSGAYGNKLYVSMQNVNTGIYSVFVYDTRIGVWTKEDDLKVNQFLNIDNNLMIVTDDTVYSVCDLGDDVFRTQDYEQEKDFDWKAETGEYGYSYANNKYLSRFQIRMMLGKGARASFYIQYDSDGIWHRRGEMSPTRTKTFMLPITPMRCDHMKFKIEGTGECKIYSISKILEEGGDV